jgi:hypothetical protein
MPCYVGICPTCGYVIAAAVDEPARKKENAKFVASLIRDGISIVKHSVEEVRREPWCKCPRKSRKTK